MKLKNIVILLFYSAFVAYGQDDTRAQKIVDEATAKFKTYPSVSIDFSATVTQLQDKSESACRGKIWMKGMKYKLEIPDYIIYFDGAKIYQYMPNVKEVNVVKPDTNNEDEDLQMLNPQAFFNLSSSQFKSNLVRETSQNNRKVYEIDLYPVQLQKSRYSRIRLQIEKETLQIAYLKAFFRDGAQYALSFSPYTTLKSLPDSDFTFNKTEHNDVEIIDLTF